ncbi:MAG: CpsD/CapB family tyrosine-protein kinase [Candidatus Eisenbacteria bacterium]|nr:CpsD/CapB family tyrosine-protein kinase [Candidatus Eisenbacteria bacterium]
MSKIYEALNKAKREREGNGSAGSEEAARADLSGKKELSRQLRKVWTHYEALHSSLGKVLSGVRGKAILFVSSVEGEGTTTVLTEYGASLGTGGDKGTLLVDANLRNPNLHSLFDLPNETGLADVLLGRRPLAECVSRIGEENLYVLPSGTTPTSPSTLFSVSRFSRFLEDAKERHSLILIDGPPMIPYAETAILGSVVDGVVLVVESDRTKREIVARAKDAFQEAHANLLGVVLNRRRYVIPKFLYRYL